MATIVVIFSNSLILGGDLGPFAPLSSPLGIVVQLVVNLLYRL